MVINTMSICRALFVAALSLSFVGSPVAHAEDLPTVADFSCDSVGCYLTSDNGPMANCQPLVNVAGQWCADPVGVYVLPGSNVAGIPFQGGVGADPSFTWGECKLGQYTNEGIWKCGIGACVGYYIFTAGAALSMGSGC